MTSSGSIVSVTLPFMALSLGAVTVDGFWHEQANIAGRRWATSRTATVPWHPRPVSPIAWWPVLPQKEN